MTNYYTVFSVLICLKIGWRATFVLWRFQLKLKYYKSSESFVSGYNRVLPENIGLMYSKIFLDSKFKFSRKCQNKSVCVRRFLRCIWVSARICILHWLLTRLSIQLSPGIKLYGQQKLISPISLNLRVLSPGIKLYGQLKLFSPRCLNLRVLSPEIKLYGQLKLISPISLNLRVFYSWWQHS